MASSEKIYLLQFLNNFGLLEVRTLCFYMKESGFSKGFDDLGGESVGLQSIILSLLDYTYRENKAAVLIDTIKTFFPQFPYKPPMDTNAAVEELAKTTGRGAATDETSKRQVAATISSLERPIAKRILWVDDNPAGVSNECCVLEKLGIEVVNVVNNREAYLQVRQTVFDLIITDVGRYEGGFVQATNGRDLVPALHDLDRNMTVIVYSSEVARDPDLALRLLTLGVSSTCQPGQLIKMVLGLLAPDSQTTAGQQDSSAAPIASLPNMRNGTSPHQASTDPSSSKA